MMSKDPSDKATETDVSNKRLKHAPGAVRHVEKRRTGTCQFADRVARVSLDAYRSRVPQWFRDKQKQTVVATIVAHFEDTSELQVLGLGAGTKFLSEEKLRAEEQRKTIAGESSFRGYGWQVRDCHAEVLARRAFRRHLGIEVGRALAGDCTAADGYRPILQRTKGKDRMFELRQGVTLHLYSSSAPCGNATLKKFTRMHKDKFDSSLGPDEWPSDNHEPIPGHSLKLGEFALLVKKDPFSSIAPDNADESRHHIKQKGKVWPSQASDTWCPPGTSVPSFHKGSIHTCSDKICRWNCLGLQGSLLSSVLKEPLFLASVVVGRKYTPIICRRAVCCRAHGYPDLSKKGDADRQVSEGPVAPYRVHHPAIMGTGVYMSESDVIDMTVAALRGKDVSFDSTLSWVWWPSIGKEHLGSCVSAECIDGTTGLALACDFDRDPECDEERNERPSLVCTVELTQHFIELGRPLVKDVEVQQWTTEQSLLQLRGLKRSVSPAYEQAKDELLQGHRVFRHWNRREQHLKESNTR